MEVQQDVAQADDDMRREAAWVVACVLSYGHTNNHDVFRAVPGAAAATLAYGAYSS
jgi:hypothetical protein